MSVLQNTRVSNASDATYLDAEKAKKEMDFDHLFNFHNFKVDNNWDMHNNARKHEILVPPKIRLDLIIGVL
jgi:hypothetical protein